MAVAFHPGQTLGQDDLKITIRDSGSTLIDPYFIGYSLFDFTTGVEVLIGPPDRIPATTGVGQYYVNATLPLDSNIGDWVVRWNFRETPSSPLVQVAQEFAVVASSVTLSATGSVSQDELLKRLRILLRDNNPDRNYSIDGKELVEIKAGGILEIVSMEELYNIIEDGENGRL